MASSEDNKFEMCGICGKLDFYKDRKLLHEVDGLGTISEITERILNILE